MLTLVVQPDRRQSGSLRLSLEVVAQALGVHGGAVNLCDDEVLVGVPRPYCHAVLELSCAV